MSEYPKIQTIWKRQSEKPCRILEGQFSEPAFEYLQHNLWVFTEKVDGTNIRIMWDGTEVIFGGKTDNAQIPAFLVARLQTLFLTSSSKERLREVFPSGAILYGEGYGARIQKGGGNYKADGVDFVLFDVRVGTWWLERPNVEDIAANLSLQVVPVIGQGTLHELVDRVKQGIISTWGDFPAEGIVARPTTELQTRSGHRIITKLKAVDYR